LYSGGISLPDILAEVETIGLSNLLIKAIQNSLLGTLKAIESLFPRIYLEIILGLLKIKVVGDFF
tara:strand:+ start:393 stop:587 length:195 start_codon:yes stop_codon:yes gene_type:complete